MGQSCSTLNPRGHEIKILTAIERLVLCPSSGPSTNFVAWYSDNQALTWRLLRKLQEDPAIRTILWPRPGEPHNIEMTPEKDAAYLELSRRLFANQDGYNKRIEADPEFYSSSVRLKVMQLRGRYCGLRGWAWSGEIKVHTPYFPLLCELSGDNEPGNKIEVKDKLKQKRRRLPADDCQLCKAKTGNESKPGVGKRPVNDCMRCKADAVLYPNLKGDVPFDSDCKCCRQQYLILEFQERIAKRQRKFEKDMTDRRFRLAFIEGMK